MRIIGSHVDSPRIDLKQNPLYEDGNLALMDTHYYGGVKKISMGYTAFSITWNSSKKGWYKDKYCYWRR